MDHTALFEDTTEDALLSGPRSKLTQLLKATTNPAGCLMAEKDRSYLEGWQHALMAIQGKPLFNQRINQNFNEIATISVR